jgi:hypothetical protein
MSYTSEEGRTRLLEELSASVEQLGLGLAALGEAYEHVDERSAETLEAQLFRPVQAAYGRARRAHSEFAARHGIPAQSFATGSPGPHSADPRTYVERGIDAIERADQLIADLQDSMLPVEVGDRDLREGLTAVRELIAPVPAEARRFLRTLGR